MIHIPQPTCFGPSRSVFVLASLCILLLQGKQATVYFLSLQREISVSSPPLRPWDGTGAK